MFVCISLAWTKSRYWGDFPRGESRKYWFFHWESWNGICQTTVTCGICFSYNFQPLCFKLRCDWHRNLYSFQVYNLRIQYLCINITLFWNMSQIQGNRWYMMFELVHSQKSYVTVTTLDILSADFPGSFWAHYFLCNDRSGMQAWLRWVVLTQTLSRGCSHVKTQLGWQFHCQAPSLTVGSLRISTFRFTHLGPSTVPPHHMEAGCPQDKQFKRERKRACRTEAAGFL